MCFLNSSTLNLEFYSKRSPTWYNSSPLILRQLIEFARRQNRNCVNTQMDVFSIRENSFQIPKLGFLHQSFQTCAKWVILTSPLNENGTFPSPLPSILCIFLQGLPSPFTSPHTIEWWHFTPNFTTLMRFPWVVKQISPM